MVRNTSIYVMFLWGLETFSLQQYLCLPEKTNSSLVKLERRCCSYEPFTSLVAFTLHSQSWRREKKINRIIFQTKWMKQAIFLHLLGVEIINSRVFLWFGRLPSLSSQDIICSNLSWWGCRQSRDTLWTSGYQLPLIQILVLCWPQP